MLRYATTGLVTLMIVAVATAWVSRRVGTQDAIADADRVTSIAAESAVEPLLDDGIVDMDPAVLAAIDHVVRNQVRRGSLVRVKIWGADGTILYSDEPRLIGERFDLDFDKLEALAGEDVHAHVSDLDDPENRFEEQADKLLEVYQLLETKPDNKPVLFEAYFRYAQVEEAGRRAWLRFAPVTLGSLVLLELLQVPLATSLARRLRRTQDQREQLLRSAIEATDAERRRIASDLHDGVVQDLAGVAFSLSAAARADHPPNRDEIREAGDQVRDSVRALRSLLVEIYPPNLYEEGLEAALGDLTAKVETRGIVSSLVVDAPVERLATDQTQLVYRAAQEGLRNVAAHAGASQVAVRVNGDGKTVVLQVIDNGRGMPESEIEERNDHMGLKTLSGLAATMGATVSLSSAPGRGTVLTLKVPIR
ncbi:MAG: histidine kinase [Acidimicrobiia bacterium]|nr:histidine kinase [Acidimicrobiia bacterium]MDH5288901.1 histidine kinase [Acidimicrobiia bacterium]